MNKSKKDKKPDKKPKAQAKSGKEDDKLKSNTVITQVDPTQPEEKQTPAQNTNPQSLQSNYKLAEKGIVHLNAEEIQKIEDAEPKLETEQAYVPVTESSSSVKVVARFRPLNSLEKNMLKEQGMGICVKYHKLDSCYVTNSVGFGQNFTLDRIFNSDCTQQEMFDFVAKPTIDDILKGFNGTIFTYGQSGSGKTHTMYGASLYDNELKGIVPRSIEHMFNYIHDPKNAEIKFTIKFSMLEIYKEMLQDLLNPEIPSKDLKISENKKKQIYVKNLTEEYITNIDEFLLLIDQADQYRVVSETGLNKQSSRSHLLFIIEVSQELPDGTERCGKLNLIDLAGSEKISKTGAVGETLEEGIKINLSLSTLGNVISSLSSEKDYIPYRDSKLTRILQDSLGGNYKTSLIVTCSPHIFNSEETAATLKFATRAKKIKNKVKQNIKRSTEELERMIESLNQKLIKAKNHIALLKKKIREIPPSLRNEYKINEEEIEEKEEEKPKPEPEKKESTPSVKSLKESKEPSLKQDESSKMLKKKSSITLGEQEEKKSELDRTEAENQMKELEEKAKKERLMETFNIKEEEEDEEEEGVRSILKKNTKVRLSVKNSQENYEASNLSDYEDNKHQSRKKLNIAKPVNNSNANSVRNKLTQMISDKDEEIVKLKDHIDKLTQENKYLIGNKKIIQENNPNQARQLHFEEVYSKVEVLIKNQIEIISQTQQMQSENLISKLTIENKELKAKLSNIEKDYKINFKRMKIFANENYLEKNLKEDDFFDIENLLQNQKQKDCLLFEYKDALRHSKSFFRDVIQFFVNKMDFFNNNIYDSSIEALSKVQNLKMNTLKEAFIK